MTGSSLHRQDFFGYNILSRLAGNLCESHLNGFLLLWFGTPESKEMAELGSQRVGQNRHLRTGGDFPESTGSNGTLLEAHMNLNSSVSWCFGSVQVWLSDMGTLAQFYYF